MNFKLILKAIFLIAVLALLVVLGKNNEWPVSLDLQPILTKSYRLPAAYMYYAFFGIGFLAGAIVFAGGGGSSKGGGK